MQRILQDKKVKTVIEQMGVSKDLKPLIEVMILTIHVGPKPSVSLVFHLAFVSLSCSLLPPSLPPSLTHSLPSPLKSNDNIDVRILSQVESVCSRLLNPAISVAGDGPGSPLLRPVCKALQLRPSCRRSRLITCNILGLMSKSRILDAFSEKTMPMWPCCVSAQAQETDKPSYHRTREWNQRRPHAVQKPTIKLRNRFMF